MLQVAHTSACLLQVFLTALVSAPLSSACAAGLLPLAPGCTMGCAAWDVDAAPLAAEGAATACLLVGAADALVLALLTAARTQAEARAAALVLALVGAAVADVGAVADGGAPTDMLAALVIAACPAAAASTGDAPAAVAGVAAAVCTRGGG
jgi:hypothetical protein